LTHPDAPVAGYIRHDMKREELPNSIVRVIRLRLGGSRTDFDARPHEQAYPLTRPRRRSRDCGVRW